MRAGVVALCLISGIPAATVPSQSVDSQAPGHPLWQPGSVAGVQFWIVANTDFILMDEHHRSISIFIEPEMLTAGNAKLIFRHLSEQYPSEDTFEVEVLTNDQQVSESESWFDAVQRFPFGNVPPIFCSILPEERVSADYHRSDLSESFHCYSCEGSNGQPISEDLSPFKDCQMRGEGPADLFEASALGCTDSALGLLNRGLDPNVRAPHGGVPLVKAALWGRSEIVSLLLERGANVNLTSSSGWTPLIAAAFRRGSGTILRLLLRNGADVNVRSQDGRTVLMHAVRHQDPKLVKELIMYGADIHAVDGYGRTALKYAEEERRPEMVRLLRREGAQ